MIGCLQLQGPDGIAVGATKVDLVVGAKMTGATMGSDFGAGWVSRDHNDTAEPCSCVVSGEASELREWARSGALRGAELGAVDWSGKELHGAQLQSAQLQGANLSFCDLREADLTGANLSGARLDGAQLEGAKLDLAVLLRSGVLEVDPCHKSIGLCCEC